MRFRKGTPSSPPRLRGALMPHEQLTERRRRFGHPMLAEAAASFREGRITRRDLLRVGALLGGGAAALGALLSPGIWGAPPPANADADVRSGDPRAGGVLRCAMPIYDIADPAVYDWTEKSNLTRHQNEYLTITGADNITRPMLAESWSASDDLRTWTFQLRGGVVWHNGDAFTTEDVAFNFKRWLDPALGSSNLALFGALKGGGGGVEIVDARTFRLHLATPLLSLPENLHNYPTQIVHRSFEGDVIAKPLGTGAYRVSDYAPGEYSASKRFSAPGWRYWGAEVSHIGPGWLDEIRYLHHARDGDGGFVALADGAVDMVCEFGADRVPEARALPEVRVLTTTTAQTGVMRMRVDRPPFTDFRVRKALQLCCDASAYPDHLFGGEGRMGEHHHVAPVHLDYHRLPPFRRNIEAAKALLTEAGYAGDLAVTLEVGNTSGVWQQRACELYASQAAEAGVRVAVEAMPPDVYQARWKEADFGLTQWTHRPLGTMALSLAYRSDVPWNETRYASPSFDSALTEAEAHIDLGERREAMERVQTILQDDAVIIQPVWAPAVFAAHARVRGLAAHPAQYHHFGGVWLETA